MGVRASLVALLGLLTGCLQSDVVECGDVLCAPGQVCHDQGERCVFPDQLEACETLAEGEACTSGGTTGACRDGVCMGVGCGNLRMDPGEACDDGDFDNGDGCNATCTSDESCGNGVLDTIAGEQCDDGDLESGDGCQADCLAPQCGDGVVDAVLQEECDLGADNADVPDAACRSNCRVPVCGDGIPDVLAGEVCDDGNLVGGDMCTPDCESDESCGNGIIDFFGGELCDDGDRASHDGCASQCQPEEGDWRQVIRGTPISRRWHATAYDARRGRVVMFGGYIDEGSDNFSNDTWEWDGATWIQKFPQLSPSERERFVMVYDSTRGVVVLFGGSNAGGGERETWEWDGENWTLRTPANSPPARREAAAAFDAKRGVLVLFGGAAGSTYLADTWEWDGTNWTERFPVDSPPQRFEHVMSYDPVREKVVLFGGWGSGTKSDTWEWDGSNWVDVTPDTGVQPGRYSAAMVFDPSRGTSLLFGGVTLVGSGWGDDLWEWNGSQWSPIAATERPPARAYHALAADIARRRLVMFGGYSSADGKFGDTWEWTGTTWEMHNETHAPGAWAYQDGSVSLDAQDFQSGFTSAYIDDCCSGGFLYSATSATGTGNKYMYWSVASTSYVVQPGDVIDYDVYIQSATSTWGLGGIDLKNSDGTYWRDATDWIDRNGLSGHPTADLSAFAFGQWYHRSLAVPPSMVGKTIVQWDVVNENDTASMTARVYYDNLVIMTQDFPTAVRNPPPRYNAALATDTTRGTILLYGGNTNPGGIADTWEWDGVRWTERMPADVPPARELHAMTYDAGRDRIVMFGGYVGGYATNETWEWNGVTWTQAFPEDSPSGRAEAGMAYDDARGTVLLFGGNDSAPGLLSDTWEWDGTNWELLSPATTPPPRSMPGIAYDAARGRVVMFGGWSNSSIANKDTWEWDGVDWIEHTTAIGPSARGGFGMTYHEAAERMILVGGYDDNSGELLGDTWEWDGVAWTQLFPENPPEGREGLLLAYDSVRREVLMFGGDTETSYRANESWIFLYDSALRDESCLGYDTDDDELAGCADDDCAGSCNTCGDGVCQPIEGCRLCPEDCDPCTPVCGDLICDSGETCPGDC